MLVLPSVDCLAVFLPIDTVCDVVSFRLLRQILTVSTGAMNVITPSTFVAGVLTYVWPFLTNKSGYAAVGFLYG